MASLELTPQQRGELIEKAAQLRELAKSPGWAVFRDLFDRGIQAELNVETIDVKGMSNTKIGEELRIQRKVVRRLRIIFENMVQLTERGENEARLLRLKADPGGIIRHYDKPQEEAPGAFGIEEE